MKKELSKIAYERFKLSWLICHNYSLEDFVAGVTSVYNFVECEEQEARELFAAWEKSFRNATCFDYPDFDSFMKFEFKNRELMKQILSTSEFEVYKDLTFEESNAFDDEKYSGVFMEVNEDELLVDNLNSIISDLAGSEFSVIQFPLESGKRVQGCVVTDIITSSDCDLDIIKRQVTDILDSYEIKQKETVWSVLGYGMKIIRK